MRNHLLILLLLSILAGTTSAVEVAPRISDREIIEALAELKAGQKAIEQRFEDQKKIIDQRFEAVDQRFDSIDQRFESIEQRFDSIDQRFAAVDQRFQSLEAHFDKRFTFVENLLLVLIGGVFGLIGFIVWDRKTAMKPLEERLLKLEHDLQRDLEIQHEEGSRLTRLVKVLREMARHDEKLADVLRSFSLL